MNTILDKQVVPAKTEILPVIKVINTKDHVAVMDPPIPLLEPLLQYRSSSFVPGGPTGVVENRKDVTLCDFDLKGRLAFPAGMLPRMVKELRKHGYRVRIEDQRKAEPSLFMDEDVLDD